VAHEAFGSRVTIPGRSMFRSNRILLFLAFALCALWPRGEALLANEPMGGGIAGTWVVRWEGQPRSEPVTEFTIQVTGNAIEVRGDSWNGRGTFEVQQGHFTWAYTDGRSGKTTFWLDGKGALHGQVRGPTVVDWDFIATRQ
jgi:hypothetical protein